MQWALATPAFQLSQVLPSYREQVLTHLGRVRDADWSEVGTVFDSLVLFMLRDAAKHSKDDPEVIVLCLDALDESPDFAELFIINTTTL